jgi:hypothetical protein
MAETLHALCDAIAADGDVSAEEALRLRKEIFPDGIVSRKEADALVALARRVATADKHWTRAYVEAIVDHALAGSGMYPGHVDEETAAWLANALKGGARGLEIEALLRVLDRSQSAPEALCAFARDTLSALLAGRPIGAYETELVRLCLYAVSGSGAISVTETEARWLFALDAESDGRANDPAWGDLFVKAVLNHLMGRVIPAELAQENLLAREAWLRARRNAFPGASVLSVFEGGVGGFMAKLKLDDVGERMESYYEAQNAAAEESAKLTLSEAAWAAGLTRADDKRTANERALLAEIERLQKAATV